MDAKKKQVKSEEIREERGEEHREERKEPPEFEIPEEMEAWALDDMSDLVPTTFAFD
jgi:hypothetical protein